MPFGAIYLLLLAVFGGSGWTTGDSPAVSRRDITGQECSLEGNSVCASRLSKCLLTKACNCTMQPSDLRTRACECCERCIACLGEHLLECCSCIDLCEAAPPTIPPEEAKPEVASDVEDFDDFIFDSSAPQCAFEEHFAPMRLGWSFYEFPAYNRAIPKSQAIQLNQVKSESCVNNCTVVYVDECLAIDKCRSRCEALSASSMRWFHTGCCECVGERCPPDGYAGSLCKNCAGPLPEIKEIAVSEDL